MYRLVQGTGMQNSYKISTIQKIFWPILLLTVLSITIRSDEPTRFPFRMQEPFKKKYMNDAQLEPIQFEVKHETEAGEAAFTRHGMLLKRPNPKAIILICHGFMCNKFDSGFLRLIFPDYNVMTFDFRAHGENICNQQCCTFGRDEAKDVLAAVEYIKSRPDLAHLPRIVYGFSMGAVASILAQSEDPSLFTAMILDCPYDHSENVIKKGLENMRFSLFGFSFSLPGRSFLEKYAFHPYVQGLLKTVLKTVANMDATATNTYIYPVSPAESIKNVTVPCLFIHCQNDEKVPAQAALKIFDGAQGHKRLWLTEGRRHFDSFFYNPEKYVYKITRFIEKVLSGELKHKERAKIMQDALS